MESVFEILAEELAKMGHDVRWFFPSVPSAYPAWVDSLHGRVVVFGARPLRAPAHGVVEMGIQLANALRCEPEPDAFVIAGGSNAGPTILSRIGAIALPPQVSLWSWVHSSLTTLAPPDRETLRWLDGHLAISTGIADELEHLDPGKPVATIYGVNGYLFTPGDEGALRRLLRGVIEGTLFLPDEEVCVRSVERFRPEVVAASFVRALETFRDMRPVAQVHPQ